MNNIDVNQYEFAETSRKNKIKSAIEAMLFVAGEPLNIKDIYTNLELAENKTESLVRYYKCTLMGIILDWLENDASYDLIAFFPDL